MKATESSRAELIKQTTKATGREASAKAKASSSGQTAVTTMATGSKESMTGRVRPDGPTDSSGSADLTVAMPTEKVNFTFPMDRKLRPSTSKVSPKVLSCHLLSRRL